MHSEILIQNLKTHISLQRPSQTVGEILNKHIFSEKCRLWNRIKLHISTFILHWVNMAVSVLFSVPEISLLWVLYLKCPECIARWRAIVWLWAAKSGSAPLFSNSSTTFKFPFWAAIISAVAPSPALHVAWLRYNFHLTKIMYK